MRKIVIIIMAAILIAFASVCTDAGYLWPDMDDFKITENGTVRVMIPDYPDLPDNPSEELVKQHQTVSRLFKETDRFEKIVYQKLNQEEQKKMADDIRDLIKDYDREYRKLCKMMNIDHPFPK